MNQLKITGGARIGMANATWPFVTLKVDRDQLELNASIIGNLIFQPADIISIEPYRQIPVLGQGIKINHKVDSYKRKVIFWTFKNPESVIRQIKETGFLDNQQQLSHPSNEKIKERQRSGGFPLKKTFAIGTVIIWNLLFLVDIIPFIQGKSEKFPIGNGALVALGLIFTSALLSLISEGFRKLILKDGRTLEDIKIFSIFIMMISGMMFLSFLTFTKLTVY